MNALMARLTFWICIVDQSGPIGNTVPVSGNWRHHAPDVLEQLVRAAYPGLTVLSAKWATSPRDYTISDDVLLVEIPGTHVVAVPKKKRAAKAKRYSDEDVELRVDLDEGPADWRADLGLRGVLARQEMGARTAPERAPAPKSDEVVNTCPTCRTSYTEATWLQLELLGTKEIRENGVVLFESHRQCTCGSSRMIFTVREEGK